MVGMALHEKGRKIMAESKWKSAVELLLQADNSFNHWCIAFFRLGGILTAFDSAPQFLEAVDNHAFLHLDICWCYFKLKVIFSPAVLASSPKLVGYELPEGRRLAPH